MALKTRNSCPWFRRATWDCWQKERRGLFRGNIHDGRLFRNFVAAGDHAAQEQVFFRGKAQNDTRLLILRRNREAGKVRQIFRT